MMNGTFEICSKKNGALGIRGACKIDSFGVIVITDDDML